MTKAVALPREADLIDYELAVAGHDGVLSTSNGELFIKPCTAAEANFYEESITQHPDFAEYMPTFLGTLELSANQNATFEEQGAKLLAQHARPTTPNKIKKIVTNMAVVLENAAHGFKRPNIMDVKLGVRLWADDAKQEKKDRFDKITAETTHKNLGFRIAGMRVWQGCGARQTGTVNADGYRIYDKEFGKTSVSDANVSDPFRDFFSCKSAGVDEELRKIVIQAFLNDLARIQQVLENQESRMYSASLLFVFEGDGDALRVAMEQISSSTHLVAQEHDGRSDEEEDEEVKAPKIYSLNVIDFAHAQWLPGMGPDDNSLLGVRSIAKILEDLAAET